MNRHSTPLSRRNQWSFLAPPATPRTSNWRRQIGKLAAPALTENKEIPPQPAQPKNEEPASIPLSEVLLENAKLLAKLEGKDEVFTERNRLIDELRDDRTFLREELTEAR